VQTSEQPDCGGTNTARTVLLSTLAVCIGVLLAALLIAFFTINRMRGKKETRQGDMTGMTDANSNNTLTPPSIAGRSAWSEHEHPVVSPSASGQRITSGSASGSPASESIHHHNKGGVVAGGFGSYSGKMAAAASFGSVMGATGKLGEESDSPRSGSPEYDGVSQASLAPTLAGGMGAGRPGHYRSSSSISGTATWPVSSLNCFGARAATCGTRINKHAPKMNVRPYIVQRED
jgi:hypothetical protein